jgi:hypothetical protein
MAREAEGLAKALSMLKKKMSRRGHPRPPGPCSGKGQGPGSQGPLEQDPRLPDTNQNIQKSHLKEHTGTHHCVILQNSDMARTVIFRPSVT